MTFHTTAPSLRALLLAAPLLVLAACSDSPTGPDDHDAEPVTAEVYERGTENLLADVHGDHWDGNVTLSLGEEIAIDVRFFNADGDEIALGGDYTVEAEFAPGLPTDVVLFDAHGDHIDLEGVAVGETGLILHFWHGGHADWSTPALPVVVEAVE